MYLRNKTKQKVLSESNEVLRVKINFCGFQSFLSNLDKEIYFVLLKTTFRFYFQEANKMTEVVHGHIT